MTSGSGTSTQTAKDNNPTAPNKTINQSPTPSGSPTSQSSEAASAKETFDKVKESAGTMANEALGQAKEKASSVLDEQKTNLASGITSVADSIRQVGENLSHSDENNQIAALAGKYGESLAGQVEKFSSYIDDKELKELVRDVEQFAKRNPALFIGGAFALGILAARFLKSSGQKQSSGKRLKGHSANEKAQSGGI
ncbi:MAG: hypothetical protein LH614_01345 [Pyrinomonadaceae bacterium]|nr:hypothetical protein [Pyrinomonadaceae bacterium]